MAFGFSGGGFSDGSAQNIRPRPPLREDFAIIREEPNLRVAFADNPKEEYEVERLDSQGNATVVGSSSSPDILVPSQAREHRIVAKNSELGIRGTPSVPKRELKPEHRWQMPQPRNLLSDPKSFDPANTAWGPFGLTYNGTVDNVGPNGETAHSFTVDSSGADLKQSFSDVDAPLTVGAFVRAKSSQFSASTIFRNSDSGSSISKSVTVDTDWSWVTSTNTSQDAVDELRVFDGLPSGSTFYILRAVLNRGNSRLFSTRSQVPQQIPDVVQGADLSNGSTDSPDTNDLDFGVDAEGVPYAVGDGDDKTETVTNSLTGHRSIALRCYVPSGWDDGNGHFITDYIKVDRFARWTINYRDKDNNNAQATLGGTGSVNFGAWNTLVFTVENEDLLRLNANGTSATDDASSKPFPDDSRWSLISPDNAGRVQHIEQHPVLTEAEAEAVRQRLATNPPDPVAVTEAWDFSAKTNPHNLIAESENFDPNDWWGATRSTSFTADVDGVADKCEDTDGTKVARWETPSFSIEDGETYTVNIKVKKDSDTSRFPEFRLSFFGNTGVGEEIVLNTSDGSFDERETDGSATVVDKGDYWLVSLTLTNTGGDTGGVFRFRPAWSSTLTGSKDGSITGSIIVKEAQRVRGDDVVPPYAPTNGSIAFPQVVPALRDSSNDLELGSTSGADTNDPDWVAPIGLVGDGNDDLAEASNLENITQANQVSFAVRTKATPNSDLPRVFSTVDLNNENLGVEILRYNNFDSRVQVYVSTKDDGGSRVETLISGVIDDSFHVVVLSIDLNNRQGFYLVDDGSIGSLNVPDSGLLSAVSHGKIDLFDAVSGVSSKYDGVISHFYACSRALSVDEMRYVSNRILDNPQSPHPEYTNP